VHSTPVILNEQTVLFSIIHDVTDRKRMESALHESEAQLRDVINTNLDGLIVVDRSGIVRLGNPAAAKLLKRPIKKLVGQRFGLPTDSNESTEIDLIQPDGEFHTVEMRVSNFHWLNSPAYLVCLRDATERKRLLKQLQYQAETDVLTSISNRRHFLELASKEIARAIRQNHPLAIAVVDLDNLKQVNDTHGHARGDLVLKKFTVICKNYIRTLDVFARIGGDEFVLLLVETSADQAYQILERIRTAIMEQSINPDGISVSFTISVGISSLENMSDSLDRLLSLADMALYRAKQAGRNKVVIERNIV